MLKLTKITSLLFLCNILSKKWAIKLIFCILICMKVSYKLKLWFLMGMVKHSWCSQNSKFTCLYNISKKEIRDEVDFLHTDKYQSFLQVDFNTWAWKCPTRWYHHYWWTWSTILKVIKVTSLQSLYNISKKKLTIRLFNKNMIFKILPG